MRWREAGALVVWAFNLVPGFPGGWVQYIYEQVRKGTAVDSD